MIYNLKQNYIIMWKIIGGFLLIGVIIITTSSVLRSCNETSNVIHEEFGSRALLKKYQDFKSLSGAIDNKRADIMVYQEELKDKDPNKMDKDERSYYQQRKSELIGIVSMHNNLCRDYNTKMAEFNYRFTNVGDLPASNLTPLPREIKPYIISLK